MSNTDGVQEIIKESSNAPSLGGQQLIENIIYAFIVVFSLTLAIIAGKAFRDSGNSKIMIVAAAFILFLAKGILLSVQLFTSALNLTNLWIFSGLLDIGILCAIFLATLKR